MKLRWWVLSMLIAPGVSSMGLAVRSLAELRTHSQHAREFLCNQGYCLNDVPPIVLEEVAGYLGYVDRDLTRISISPRLDAGDTQLALVHELAHVYRAQFNLHEETWLNEGIAKFLEYRYSGVWPVSYMTRLRRKGALTFGPLSLEGKEGNYGPGGDGYPASFFLVLYLYNHFGQEKFLSKILRSSRVGWDNVLGAVRDLTAEGALDLSAGFATKGAILRHFAVALWLNDPYAAKYALFSVDPSYEPLAKVSSLSLLPIVADAAPREMRIQFSKKFQASSAKEVYSILSYDPVVIQKAKADDGGTAFVYLWY